MKPLYNRNLKMSNDKVILDYSDFLDKWDLQTHHKTDAVPNHCRCKRHSDASKPGVHNLHCTEKMQQHVHEVTSQYHCHKLVITF